MGASLNLTMGTLTPQRSRLSVGKIKFAASKRVNDLLPVMPETGPLPDPEQVDRPLEPAHDPYAVLRNRDLLLYLVGRFVASMGQQMLTVAIGWELYERTHQPVNLGFVGLTQMIPMILFTLPAGHVADNHDRKQIIVAMTFIIASASAALAYISARQLSVLWV